MTTAGATEREPFAELERAVHSEPTSGSAWECLGRAYLVADAYDLAQTAFEQAVRLDPGEAEPLVLARPCAPGDRRPAGAWPLPSGRSSGRRTGRWRLSWPGLRTARRRPPGPPPPGGGGAARSRVAAPSATSAGADGDRRLRCAGEAFEASLRLDPDQPVLWSGLGSACSSRAARPTPSTCWRRPSSPAGRRLAWRGSAAPTSRPAATPRRPGRSPAASNTARTNLGLVLGRTERGGPRRRRGPGPGAPRVEGARRRGPPRAREADRGDRLEGISATPEEGPMPFSVRADRRLIRRPPRSRRLRSGRDHRSRGRAPRRSDPVNLAFAIDCSGSMAATRSARRARPPSRASARSGRRTVRRRRVTTTTWTWSSRSSLATRRRGRRPRRIAGIGDRGSIDLHAGGSPARGVGRALRDDAVGRCLLLTDGLANQGITSPDEIASRVAALRQRRISTSALGVGSDFDEHLLAQVAEAGGGNFHFIEGASQIPEFMGAEVGEALAITARDVVIAVEAGEGVLVESLNDFPCTRQADGWRVELGSMFGGQVLDRVLASRCPEDGRCHPRGSRPRRGSRGCPRRARAAPSRSRGRTRRERRPGATASWIDASRSSMPRGRAEALARSTGAVTSRPRAGC